MSPRYPLVSERAGHRCEYCHAPEIIFNFPFEIEHIIPITRGGTDDEANLALACRCCNVWKADHLTGVDGATQSAASLFNPRRDSWDYHFSVDVEEGLIQGLTPAGRATVNRLKMNAGLQVAARRQWIRLGLFV
ncbi:MAG TPA: HNH endonuclease signature motif containing protein [Blastocatellia bacterium]|jgi:hypothetical protein|nr:HNH endonuclease signature motif containing protein [Blastocatellia bacterium]